MQPKLSVIIPVYNASAYIAKCLTSVLTQTLDGIECIVIDDGSNDDSLEVIKTVSQQHPGRDVKVIAHQVNKGLAYTRAEGLSLATGEYVIHCDSDDWVDAGLYADMYALAKNERADIVVTDFVIEEGNRSVSYKFPLWHDWLGFFSHPRWEFLAIWAHMIRRDFLADNHLDFYPDVNYAEDYGLLFRCYYYSKKNAVYSGTQLYHYSKQNTGSMTATKHRLGNLQNKARCLAYLSDFVRDHGYNPADNRILSDEKRVVKEGFLLMERPDFGLWSKTFPEISATVVSDRKLSMPYRVAWWLGQYIHPVFMRIYVGLSK